MQQALFTEPQIKDTLIALRDLVADPTAHVHVVGGSQAGLHVVQRARDFRYPIDVTAHSQEPAQLSSPPDLLPSRSLSDD